MEETAQTYPLSPRAKVTVESSCGAITVSGWDRAEWRVETARWARDSAELALITMEVDAAEDHVSIRATTPPGAGRNANDSPRID